MLRKWIVVLCLHLSVGVAFAAPMSDAAKIEQGEKFYQSGKRYLDARNEDAAFRAFKRAAFLGHVGGMRLLAVCYLEGIGCWVDTDEAAYWLEYAANSGDGFSAFELLFSTPFAHEINPNPTSNAPINAIKVLIIFIFPPFVYINRYKPVNILNICL